MTTSESACNPPQGDIGQPDTRWISEDLSVLRKRLHGKQVPHVPDFDVIIIGSGYGGAMAAAEFAGLYGQEDGLVRPVKVCVLERGKEYVPGMFPSSLQELPSHLRIYREASNQTTGSLDALLDVRMGSDVTALLGNGLGGGSLINAGVMKVPNWDDVRRLPMALSRDFLNNPVAFDALKLRLGAGTHVAPNTITRHPCGKGLAKTMALKSLKTEPIAFDEAQITVALDQPSPAHKPCTLCGDCLTGCNVGAKKSLDTTLLAEAARQGAEIYTGATVLRIKRLDPDSPQPLWQLEVVYTDESMRKRHDTGTVTARRIVVAAGALGSTELMLRSHNFKLPFSPRLGQQFSCNGDNLVALHKLKNPVNDVAEEHQPLGDADNPRNVGPTITAMLTMPPDESLGERGFLVQEFAIPAALKFVFDEVVTTTHVLHTLLKPDNSVHTASPHAFAGGPDRFAVDNQAMNHTLVVGLIGHDESAGQLKLAEPTRVKRSRAPEGDIRIVWPEIRHSPTMDKAFARLEKLLQKTGSNANADADAQALPNPMWRPLAEEASGLIQNQRGPVITVHPLGGCAMGTNPLDGVVDEFGRVFNPRATDTTRPFYDGLVVLDGSIVPASLGANPALTIAAIAQRAARHLAGDWGWTTTPSDAQTHTPVTLKTRPVFRHPADCTPHPPQPTEVEIMERLLGEVQLGGKNYMAELTLRFASVTVKSLATQADRCLSIAPDSPGEPESTLRLYIPQDWKEEGLRFETAESQRDQWAQVKASISTASSMRLLFNEPSTPGNRKWQAFWPWLRNRGGRDTFESLWQWAKSLISPQKTPVAKKLCLCQRLNKWRQELLALASRAGEVRLFQYSLITQHAFSPQNRNPALVTLLQANPTLAGFKRITYDRRANPWRQLTQLHLTQLAGKQSSGTTLNLDQRFVAQKGVPLLRVVGQQNQVIALAELASLGLFMARLLISTHLWTFRAPDQSDTPSPPKLLPGYINGLPEPQVIELELDVPCHGLPVVVRLTRYVDPVRHDTTAPPLVMVHGYSASGSTFTHNAIKTPMAKYFVERGRDVWVLDMRTSPGMPSAVLPWYFEDAALADLPMAIAHIKRVTGREKVDVLAHCIGAVMLSMALLTDHADRAQQAQINTTTQRDDMPVPRRYWEEVDALPGSINKIVLSQKGPALVYSDSNVLRAYFMRALRKLVLPEGFQFRVAQPAALQDQLMDRLLASTPYPNEEYDMENPRWPWQQVTWTGFRHRMDALYARDFNIVNLPKKTLASVEDLFGTLNLDTVAQAIHFVRYNTITNGAGRNCFVSDKRMRDRWPKNGTLSVHGEENGLADVQTLKKMQALMEHADVLWQACPIPGYGHQDCLIGENAAMDVFQPIWDFLQ